MAESDIASQYHENMKSWLNRGYAVVYQHCRGQGKSTGAFVPYVGEREDGLALREWIRTQPFYNGELYLLGGSYTASLHYTTAPFEEDIKGAVLEIQDSERYRLWYRNGQMRKGHANWHFALYKDKVGLNKNFNMQSFSQLPLKNLSERVLGDRAEDFEQMLEAASPHHEFWNTRLGGIEAKDAVSHANIPILLSTGFNDFYTGGVFKMWERMDEQTKQKSALLVSPYNHGDGYDQNLGIAFEKGRKSEQFGREYQIDWIDNIRKGTELPYKKGVITYYRTFQNRWESDFCTPTKELTLPLGEEICEFEYDPIAPPALREEGFFAEDFSDSKNVVRVIIPAFQKETFVKGKMQMKLAVESNCEDTSFFVRISIKKAEYTYVLRHDITSLCYQLGEYQPNSIVELDFCFDEYAYHIEKGDSLIIDITSTNDNGYVCHTNNKGEYYLQTDTKKAVNKVHLDKSSITLPVE